ncbi:hypothetical protein PJF56_01760 [Roseofilum sp. BLCC_M91]|uniref:DUF805 domain-containing protein n=1 Tax=Roseofilum halophilum BLCC-M91 TaxID=3022259 RepID=A0ABT7BEI1_9CYAN|nr:hypothetical protein [Roseofilum halophilum]MDJ1177579.1 hypothetical protein [Roseofilum halophilum BLCC-M91]
MDILIKLITPGPFALPSGFGLRVVSSWFVSHFILTFVIAFFAIVSGDLKDPDFGYLAYNGSLFGVALCFYGLLGIAIDYMRGNRPYYPGWYWYLYPWISAFYVVILLVIFLLSLLGVSLPEQQTRKLTRDRLHQALEQSSLQDLLENYGNAFEELKKREQAGKLDPAQAEVVRKLRTFDRSKYDRKITSLLSQEEFKRLFILMLIVMLIEE